MLKAIIYVTIKEDVLDPEGNAVRTGLQELGHENVSSVRIGKYIEVMLNTNDKQAAEQQVTEMCEQLIVNTVVEDYRFELEEV